MNNHLFVTSKHEFKTLIRVAEAMSYKYDTFRISGHGKCMGKCCEVVALLLKRNRATVDNFEFGEEGDDWKYPTLDWVMRGNVK